MVPHTMKPEVVLCVMGEGIPEDDAHQVHAVNEYTHVHKWLPEKTKQCYPPHRSFQ